MIYRRVWLSTLGGEAALQLSGQCTVWAGKTFPQYSSSRVFSDTHSMGGDLASHAPSRPCINAHNLYRTGKGGNLMKEFAVSTQRGKSLTHKGQSSVEAIRIYILSRSLVPRPEKGRRKGPGNEAN